MTDLATLGLRFESQEAVTAKRRLDDLSTSATRTQRASDSLIGSIQRQGSAMGLLARSVSGLLGIAALTAVIAAVRRATLEYSASLREVSTLVDTAVVSMDELSTAAIRQAGQFNSSALTQTQALYQIISAGASTAAQATDTLTASNKLAVGGVTTVAIAADGLTSVLNAYGDKVEGATAVSDAMFVAMRAGKTTIGELSASLGTVAPLAAQTGVSFDELAAATAALTKGGISTSVAITGLRAILAAVAKPSDEAQKLAKALGLEFSASALATKGLSGFMAELSAKTGGSTDALAVLFGGVEALVPVMALSGQAGKDFTAILDQMAVKAGSTDEAFGKIASGPAFQVGRIFSTLAANALAAGSAILQNLTPAIRTADAILQGTYVHARELTTVMQILGAVMGGIALKAAVSMTAALTAQVTATVLASNTVRAYLLSVARVGPASATATAAVGLFTGALRGAAAILAGPWGIAIAGAIGLYFMLQQSSNGMSKALNDEIDAAGAAGAEYRRLRQEAEATISPMSSFGRAAEDAADGMRVARGQTEALKKEMVALGIATEHTAMQLALLAVNEAENELIRARNARPQGPNHRYDPTGAATLRVAAAQRNFDVAQNAYERAEAAFSEARRGASERATAAAAADVSAAAAAASAAAAALDAEKNTRSQAERDYDRLIKQGKEYRDGLIEERKTLGATTIEQMRYAAAAEAAKLVKEGATQEAIALAHAILDEADALTQATIAYERAEAIRSVTQNTGRIQDQLRMLELERDLIGATNVERARQLAMLQTELDLRRQAADLKQRTGVDIDLVNTSEGQAQILGAGAVAAAGEGNRATVERFNESLRAQLDILRQIDDQARSAASGLAGAFGEQGRALGDLLTTMTGYQARLEEIRLREDEMRRAGTLTAHQEAMNIRDRSQAQTQAYGDMLGAAKGFFREGSDGYKALQAAEQAYRMFQFAMSVQAMMMDTTATGASVANSMARGAASAAAGAAKMFEFLGPLGFPMVAAMLGLLAGLGLKGKGGGGGRGGSEDSVSTAQGQVASAQNNRSAFMSSVAQSVKVDVAVTADRDGMNAFVVSTARKEAMGVAVPLAVATAAGTKRDTMATLSDQQTGNRRIPV